MWVLLRLRIRCENSHSLSGRRRHVELRFRNRARARGEAWAFMIMRHWHVINISQDYVAIAIHMHIRIQDTYISVTARAPCDRQFAQALQIAIAVQHACFCSAKRNRCRLTVRVLPVMSPISSRCGRVTATAHLRLPSLSKRIVLQSPAPFHGGVATRAWHAAPHRCCHAIQQSKLPAWSPRFLAIGAAASCAHESC